MIKKIIISIFSFVILASPALAANANANINSNRPSVPQTTPVNGKGSLTQARLTVCQNHEQAINRQMEQLTNMATNMLGVFDGISARVESYYTDTAIPEGITVPQYGTLISDIASKKAAVNTALANAKVGVADFTCTSSNPRTILSSFHSDMSAVKTALQQYRSSINKLIVAVRTAVSAQQTPAMEENEASPSMEK